MITPKAFYRILRPARVPPPPARITRAMMRLLPLGLLKELRDEQAARLAVLKAEPAEAERAAAAETPTPAAPDPSVLDSAPSRTLLGS